MFKIFYTAKWGEELELDYIVVQAGGAGSRMGELTRNKPKALVAVNNLPILFRLFSRYPDKKFIIICDYKRDVLERYLEIFASARYIPVSAAGSGNVAGIRQALDFIPAGKSFMLIWSDLILGDNFSVQEISTGNYIGISKSFPCSWSCVDGVLEKRRVDGYGVAGCFIFEDKAALKNIPAEGSFTRWLAAQNIDLNELPIADTAEVGTLDAFNRINSYANRSRPYNRITFDGKIVVKEALTKDAEALLDFEIDWYRKISSVQFVGVPKIYSTKPLTMERINGDNICVTAVADEDKPRVIKKMVECLSALHDFEKHAPDPFDMEKDYCQKTLKRVRQISAAIPFSNERSIKINGRARLNPLLNLEIFYRMTDWTIRRARPFGIIHGDCTFSNTLIDSALNIYLIDARGYFGNTRLIGDADYDWAKMYYSIVGAFDQFNIKNFSLSIGDDGVDFSIAQSGWENLAEYFLSLIPEVSRQRLKFIHSIIWLSLASHCWEDYDSMCLAFYNGVELWNDALESGDWFDETESVSAGEDVDFRP